MAIPPLGKARTRREAAKVLLRESKLAGVFTIVMIIVFCGVVLIREQYEFQIADLQLIVSVVLLGVVSMALLISARGAAYMLWFMKDDDSEPGIDTSTS